MPDLIVDVQLADGQICPGLGATEIQVPRDKHHKVSSLVKSHRQFYQI